MPTEVRYVMFTAGEVLKAVMEYKKRRGESLPAGNVTKCTIEARGGPSLLIEIKSDDGIVQTVEVDGKNLTATLVFFCINNKIPLPAKASKILKMNGQRVALVIEETPITR
jgi:hypothetical protein